MKKTINKITSVINSCHTPYHLDCVNHWLLDLLSRKIISYKLWSEMMMKRRERKKLLTTRGEL